ncbi:tyrosine-type recombinase/integrase [Pseudarthrobacter sp. J1738]|uniref:tyrosine-type recombinase/integrase n=1 Tax=Pseudarthrobacter sp. J1738 TaxID=3420446 RepID=UPI003D2BDF6A
MRTVFINRQLLGNEGLSLPEGQAFAVSHVREVFDERTLPDGFPFVVDDDGGVSGCRYLNQYLLDAQEQKAFDLGNMRRFHVYHLARLLRYIRRKRAQGLAVLAGQTVEDWLKTHGEPKVDLIHATRKDLVGYRDSRQGAVEFTTLDTELGCLSSFFRYATAVGWVPANPFPQWGERNTLMSGKRKVRQARFLTTAQTAHFLSAGLRGDGSDAVSRPAAPERDYAYGLLLAATGLRREEGAFVLDNEIPPLSGMPADGVHVFERIGKMGVIRSIYVTAEVARTVDLYRQTERAALVRRHQASLRRLRRQGRLLIFDGFTRLRGQPAVVNDGHPRSTLGLTDEDRARAVRILDDGSIEPLALFIARGLPPVPAYWNELFSDARDRVFELGGPNRPPAHITVTPHTFRHTFAVTMLASLMQEGRERAGDPYLLLANPVLTVKELLGHASVSTTYQYLFAAETWQGEVPRALRSLASELVGHAALDPERDAVQHKAGEEEA